MEDPAIGYGYKYSSSCFDFFVFFSFETTGHNLLSVKRQRVFLVAGIATSELLSLMSDL